MLASINPLGERARKRRWGVTVSAYLLGSTLAAAALGAVLGGLGGLLPGDGPAVSTSTATAALLVALLAAGLAFDLGLGGLRLPTVRRQVDKDWLDRYRGWVVGFGFGFQLGLGVVTIVDTAAVYLTLALAFLSGSAPAGLAVGATFGLARGLVVLLVGRVSRPDQLRAALRRLQAWRPVSKRLGLAVQAVALVAVGAAAVTR